jgi:hypothetical protein
LLYFVLEERDLLHSLHISSQMLQANIHSS